MSRSALWQWTINAKESEIEPFRPMLTIGIGSIVRYYKFQLEEGEGGRKHYQGCMRLKTNYGLAGAKKALGCEYAHLETAKHWKKLLEYCGKEETRLDGPWEEGDPGISGGERSDLQAVCDSVKDGMSLSVVASTYPVQWAKFHKGIVSLHSSLHVAAMRPEIKVYCFYGATGTGKTRKVFEIAPKTYPVFCMKTPWFDGYAGQETMLLDDFGPGMMNINFLKRLLDRYPMDLPIKGGSLAMRANTIFITTNYHLDQWYPKAGEKDYEALMRRIEWVAWEDLESRARWQGKWDKGIAPACGSKRARAPATPDSTQVVSEDEED